MSGVDARAALQLGAVEAGQVDACLDLQQEAAVAEEAAQAPPPVAEMQRLVEAALTGQVLPGPGAVLAPRALTLGQLQDLKAALDAALQSPTKVIAHGEGRSYSRRLGLAAAVLLGHEQARLQVPSALDYAAKRLVAKVKHLNNLLHRAREAARDKRRKANSKQHGSTAELEAQLTEIDEGLAAKVAGLRATPTLSPFESGNSAARQPDACAAGPPSLEMEGARVTQSMQVAAASLALLAAPVGESDAAAQRPPSSWSCTRCVDFLRERAEAQARADEALQAKFTAEHLCSAAYGKVQEARQEARAQVDDLSAAHAWEFERQAAAHSQQLERLQAAHAAAISKARAESTAANANAEQRRKEVVQAKQHQHTLSLNSFQGLDELRKTKGALSKAQEKLQRGAAQIAALKQELEQRDAVIEEMTERLHREATRRGVAEQRLAARLAEHRQASPLREVNGVRNASSRNASRNEGDPSDCYGRSIISSLQSSLRNKDEHITMRDLKLLEKEAQMQGMEWREQLLREEVRRLERASVIRAPGLFKGRMVRTSKKAHAPLEPFSMELLRRLVEECNVSFTGAATAIVLVWSLLIEDAIPEEYIFNSTTVSNAFLRLDLLDAEEAATHNLECRAPWAFAADGGNKGKAVNVVAASVWHRPTRQPLVQPLSCSNLDDDQTAHNCAETVIVALHAAQLQPSLCMQGMSDGCTTAKNEQVRHLHLPPPSSPAAPPSHPPLPALFLRRL